MLSILPLKLENISIRKRGNTILKDISLNFGPTGLTIVMGPNGCGKTTLLRLMHGLERPAKGDVQWNCSDQEARPHQAFVFQTPILMRRSVVDNIAYPLIAHNVSKLAARSKATVWAENVGLGQVQNLPATSLSGGERQKLAIARALIIKPELVFLDEPTTNLDGKSTREIEGILQKASRDGTRIIMTTHDIGQAKRLATDVVFLNRGELCDHSAAEKFFTDAPSKAAQVYLNGEILE